MTFLGYLILASSTHAAKRNEFCTSGPCEIGSNVPIQIHCRAKSAMIVSQGKGDKCNIANMIVLNITR